MSIKISYTAMRALIAKYKRLLLFTISILSLILLIALYEMRTSRMQAQYFAQVGKELNYRLKAGPSQRIRFPTDGPHDIRHGYTRIPTIIRSLLKEGFFIEAQAEISERLANLVDWGIFSIYREKSQAGIKILDRYGDTLYSAIRPERVYKSFNEIPDLVVKTILFIENREILDSKHPYRNPAIEWDRFFKAILEKAFQLIKPNHSAAGGSTIATQLEKYRHGFEGRTTGIKDKLRQMLSASYRAYLAGEKTFSTRQDIVLNYINSIPLAALPGYGEVNGLGDGLWAWYDLELSSLNEQFMALTFDQMRARAEELAASYKKLLSLFIAHRRPSFYLLSTSSNLDSLTNEYLNLLVNNRVIPAELRDQAIKVILKVRTQAPSPGVVSFVERKAANAIRTKLLKLMRYRQLYDMDQVDLTLRSTLDIKANKGVSEVLQSLKERKNLEKHGLGGDRTLNRGDPAKVIYSVTLYERVGNVNLLRIQTDNLDRPFDINEGTRLDLGSTAKLRVLANYLEVLAIIYENFISMSEKDIRKSLVAKPDLLTRWVAEKILSNKKISLKELLDSGMERQYSANPEEVFFTGGGVHTFVNFKREDNGKVVTVQEALRHSINLPFIRLIRDVLKYYMAELTDNENSKTDNKESRRKKYLAKFADKEGSYFLQGFYQKYKGKNGSEVLGTFLKMFRPTLKKLGVIFRHIKPNSSVAEFTEFLNDHLPKAQLSEKAIQEVYDFYSPGKFSLNDQGYLIRVHPLELWLVGYMVNNPGSNFSDIVNASTDERQHVYEWLLRKKNSHAQNIRIKSLIEAEGFMEMHKAWKKVGYPFQNMVASYASAIGSSGDRPAALAELLGIILNDGVRYPMQRMERLHFAKDTPFETVVSLNKEPTGERVMRSEVSAVLRKALRDVVENGTARRVDKAFKDSNGNIIPIGGKTGTGDNRYETFGKGGQLLSSVVKNRTATFAFYIGDRFFGTVTAHVQGPEAAKYDFTSALAAELLKAVSSAVSPLVSENPPQSNSLPSKSESIPVNSSISASPTSSTALKPLQTKSPTVVPSIASHPAMLP